MTRQRRSFSIEFKHEAACLVLDQGYSNTEACRSLGVGRAAQARISFNFRSRSLPTDLKLEFLSLAQHYQKDTAVFGLATCTFSELNNKGGYTE